MQLNILHPQSSWVIKTRPNSFMDDAGRKRKPDVTDPELFSEIARKQTWAFEELYDRHAARLNGLALTILADEHLAEDVLQEIFLNIWNSAGQFDMRKGTPLGWMMIFCRNRSIDKLRSRSTQQKRSAVLDEETLLQDKHWRSESPLDTVSMNELQQAIARALALLPLEQCLPIEMAFFQGYTQREISERLCLPLGTIKTRMRLGMQKLKKFLIDAQEGLSA